MRRSIFPLLLTICLSIATCVRAEDGSKLWLRYPHTNGVHMGQIVVQGNSPTCRAIRFELTQAISGMTGAEPQIIADVPTQPDAVIVGTPDNSVLIRNLGWAADLSGLGSEGFVIRSATVGQRAVIVIASAGEIGSLYGTFHLLRLWQAGQLNQPLAIAQKPKLQRRILDHWDNLNGSVERGYAGQSLWKWDELPGKLDPRYTMYARADASIGINGAVLNNVNASAKSLSTEYLKKTAALADLWRPYGVRVYLSANFAAPKTLGGLGTADPLDPQVAAWWKNKCHEIYQIIPDFGGFLVKANSEGQPGPHEYGRTHADGANMLADALAPHGGIVMWRAFVYDEKTDPDRAKRACIEFSALDGQFRSNVLIQAKNGPVDFQPREPFHPLFGTMTRTSMMAELQITQEYLGQSKHLVYLAPMWKEVLDSDTFAHGPGSTVARVLDGSLSQAPLTGISGVANTGSDTNWCGSHFAQANWYAFGRLAWDHDLSAAQIADEWLSMTFTLDAESRTSLRSMMLSSWETFLSYSEPLGLHHWVAGDHYAPAPWHSKDVRPEYTATYYHHADADGIGFDRTSTGSGAVTQYHSPLREELDDVRTCPEKFLLWFHHVPWTYRMKSGKTLWEELCENYTHGVDQARAMQATWQSLAGKIDSQRYGEVADKLAIQVNDAQSWRDAILAYFQSVNHLPLPQTPIVESATEPKPRDAGWMKHHDALVEKARQGNIDLYLEGDSITDFWEAKFKDNWQKNLGGWKAGDFGVSGDRTEHVLWRIEHGELDHVKPRVIVLLIGTNNLKRRPEIMEDSPQETAAGIKAILNIIEERQPQARVLLLAIFPRADKPLMPEVDAVNRIIATYDDGKRIRFLNIDDKFLDADGKLSKRVMSDGLHPSEFGYQIWADAIRPTLVEWLGEPETK